MDRSKKFLMAAGEFSLTMPLAVCRGWEFTKSTVSFYHEQGYFYSSRHRNVPLSGVIYYAHNNQQIQLSNAKSLLDADIPCWPNPHTIMLFSDRFNVLKLCQELFLIDHSVYFGNSISDLNIKSFPAVIKTGCDEHSGDGKFLVKSHSELDALNLNEKFSIEPYFKGTSVRVLTFGDEDWLIETTNENSWIKNSSGAEISKIERLAGCQLRDHARECRNSFGLDMAGCDYIICEDGSFKFLEINCYPQLIVSDDNLRHLLNKFFIKKMEEIEEQSLMKF